MNTLTVVPAYGRDYKDKAEVEAAWAAGHDFLIKDIGSRWNGAYVNKDDPGIKGTTFTIRYLRLTRVCKIEVK